MEPVEQSSALESFHRVYPSTENDPYQSISFLGQGGYGSVEEVAHNDHQNIRYARKRLRQGHMLKSRRLEVINELVREARIIQRLRNHHIVKLIETYEWKDQFFVVMAPVAETDLKRYLMRLDELEPGRLRDYMCEFVVGWPVCLIRAADFLHEMRVKHRDIKPSNILIKGGEVLLTDFGLSKIVPADDTTGTVGPVGAHTYMYSAPEVLTSESRRGRAADVFSLGCIFLELSTAVVAPKGSRDQFFQLCLSRSDTLAYADNQELILHWIWFLRTHWRQTVQDDIQHHRVKMFGREISDLAFLMLDPDSGKRITTRQLVALITTERLEYFYSLNPMACKLCRLQKGYEDPIVPLHSEFKDSDDLEYAESPSHALLIPPASDWESAKRAWLERHIWWDSN
jgi:serine/threonine protein kinase